MKKIKNIKEKIESNVVFKILKWIINIIVILLLLIIIVQKVTKNNFAVGGIRIFMVVSGSMVDEYNIGDILISKATDEEDINVGDNVTYLGKTGGVKGLIVTHKVINKEKRDGNTYFVTKGIANEISDPEITYDQIYGKVIYKTIVLSFLGKLMSRTISYYILFMIVGVIISFEIVSSMFDSDREEDEDGRRE